MNYHDLGDLVRCTFPFTDVDGAAVDPTAVYVTVTTPAGAATTYEYDVDAEVVKSATGTYYIDVNANANGLWKVRAYSTGTGQAADTVWFRIGGAPTVTYRGDLTTDLDKVRFHTGDTVDGSGLRPSDGNFSDAEINGLITAEGTWERAVAACFERLAAEWVRHPTFKADGLSVNRSDIAKGYRTEAGSWRSKFGYTIAISTAGQIPKDGYSDDVATDDVDTASDYGKSSFSYVVPG